MGYEEDNGKVAARVSINAQTDVLAFVKYAKIVGVIDISNDYAPKLLGLDVSIRSLFGL